MRRLLALSGLAVFAPVLPIGLLPAQDLSVIPVPANMHREDGYFTIDNKTTILLRYGSEEFRPVAQSLHEKLQRATGFPLSINTSRSAETGGNVIFFTGEAANNDLGGEGYELSVKRNAITIRARSARGAFYATQSLYQLLPFEVEGGGAAHGVTWSAPCVEIRDNPRFPWRGMHLDVGRHFFPKEFVKKYIDLLAIYKMNTFHWHLTEDQGWRIQIKKYPQLTEVGSLRRETMGDCTPYGGFYTQDDIREVVEYARDRFITIVPEIEMPGHSLAALTAFPELSCSGGPFKVGTEWGVFNDVYCAGREETFQFLEHVLDEVVRLFPGPFVHIGGDECPKVRWKNCVRCQNRIKTEGLKDENELQSYFIKRIERILNAKGRRLLGWDEILEGGLAPNAAVMSWRGTQGGIDAAKSGHDVVMTPTSHCYFDHYQGKEGEPAAIGGYLPIDTVYSYEPVPRELSEDEARHILGTQGNMWTEWMPDSRQVEYMLMPRMLALSEVAWSRPAARDYKDFTRRLEKHFDRLAAMGANFRVPPPSGIGGRAVIFHDTLITLSSPVSGGRIFYSLDEKDTTLPVQFTQPIPIKGGEILKARTVLDNGRKSNVLTATFARVDADINGLDFKYYEGTWDSLPDFSTLTPIRSGRVYDIGVENVPHREDEFALQFSGFITIEADGDYTFTLTSDDGSKLFIGDEEVVGNDGLHGSREASGKMTLSRGKHRIRILYFERTGNQYLDASIEGPGSPKQHIPPRILTH